MKASRNMFVTNVTTRQGQEGKETEEGVCSICGNIYKSNENLQSHMKNVHGGSKYFCDICPYKCAVKTNFLRHIQLKHNGDV